MAPAQSRSTALQHCCAYTGLGFLAARCAYSVPVFAQLSSRSLPQLRSRIGPPAATPGDAISAAVRSSGTGATFAAHGASLVIAAAVGLGVGALGTAKSSTARSAAGASAAKMPAPPPFDPAAQIGVIAPVGFFDPLGLTKPGDEAGFRSLREAELKHGRVAMLASAGLLTQHFLKLPGFEHVPSGLEALTKQQGALGTLAIVIASGVFELGWRTDPFMESGTFGDPFGLKIYTENFFSKELSNGRFAMVSVLGILAAELVTGRDAVQQLGL